MIKGCLGVILHTNLRGKVNPLRYRQKTRILRHSPSYNIGTDGPETGPNLVRVRVLLMRQVYVVRSPIALRVPNSFLGGLLMPALFSTALCCQ